MIKQDLNRIVTILLDKDSCNEELEKAVNKLSKLFGSLSTISAKENHLESKEFIHTNLNSGVALSPLDAAVCTNEYKRTSKYLRGVYEAIIDLLKVHDEKIHILYAGTGPYASLVVPLLHLFLPKNIEVTFLDIHQSSLESVKAIVESLELISFVKSYECCDAATFAVTSKVHLMITETMRAAFEGEPQVNITLNLLPQLCQNGVFIPQCVTVALESGKKKNTQEKQLIKSKDHISDIIKLDTKKNWFKENIIITPKIIVDKEIEDEDCLYFTTTIEIYKKNILVENESTLNSPRELFLNTAVLKGDILEFSYIFENRPEIVYKHLFHEKREKLSKQKRISSRVMKKQEIDPKIVAKMFGFLEEIGIEVKHQSIHEASFLPGILIDKGVLVIDNEKFLAPGDLLHEAGHIATFTSKKRKEVYNDVSKNAGDELATLAWSYAALKYLEIDPSIVFHSDGYKGDSKWLIEHFENGGEMGVPLLEWMGLTLTKKSADKLQIDSFPMMKSWLRE